jgi:hypothetical protein
MASRFSSNTRKFIRAVPKINVHNLNYDTYQTGSLENIMSNGMPTVRQEAINKREPDNIQNPINLNNLNKTSYITGSLENILANGMPAPKLPNPKVNQTDFAENPTNINDYIDEYRILNYKAKGRYIQKQISSYSQSENTITINSVSFDYNNGYPTSADFEIYVKGILISNDIYILKEVQNNIVITFSQSVIDFNNIQLSDIFVYGKFVEVESAYVYLITEDGFYLITENEEYLIV